MRANKKSTSSSLEVASPKLIAENPPAPTASIAAVFSFLKETRGVVSWTVQDLAETLRIKRTEAIQIIPFLTMQGYVKGAGSDGEWMTTVAGENVSGSTTPHFTRDSVERAVLSLKQRIEEFNNDPKAGSVVEEASHSAILCLIGPEFKPLMSGFG